MPPARKCLRFLTEVQTWLPLPRPTWQNPLRNRIDPLPTAKHHGESDSRVRLPMRTARPVNPKVGFATVLRFVETEIIASRSLAAPGCWATN